MYLKQSKVQSSEEILDAGLLASTAFSTLFFEFGVWLILICWIAAACFAWAVFKFTREEKKTILRVDISAPDAIAQVMEVTEAKDQDGIEIYSGRLKINADEVYRQLKNVYSGTAIPMLQESWSGKRIILIPGQMEKLFPAYTSNPLLHIFLGVITLISTTIAGAHHLGFQTITDIPALLAGLSYSLPLLLILGIHETGHFVLARMHGMIVTPPFFIPAPFGLGTLGAVIRIKSPPMNRESLFDMAVAGPLAGFIVSIPVLILGLQSSVVSHPATPQIFMASSFWDKTPVSGSILLSLLAYITRGNAIQYGDVLSLSPLALAGWIGLWVTAFNLFPIGQLDGGHISQSMFGSKWSKVITRFAMAVLLLLAILCGRDF